MPARSCHVNSPSALARRSMSVMRCCSDISVRYSRPVSSPERRARSMRLYCPSWRASISRPEYQSCAKLGTALAISTPDPTKSTASFMDISTDKKASPSLMTVESTASGLNAAVSLCLSSVHQRIIGKNFSPEVWPDGGGRRHARRAQEHALVVLSGHKGVPPVEAQGLEA